MEPENTPNVEPFLARVYELLPGGGELELRQHIVGFLGTVQVRGEHELQRPDGYVSLVVDGDGEATLTCQVGGDGFLWQGNVVEARAYAMAANATATALGFVRQVFEDVTAELEYQHGQLLSGQDVQHPKDRVLAGGEEFPPGAAAHAETYQKGYQDALAALREGREECPHAGLPPADSVEPFGFRNCPTCGKRMRAYPPSVTQTVAKWREAL